MSDPTQTTDTDIPPVSLNIHCSGAIARLSLVQLDKEVFWVTLTKDKARLWGDAILMAAEKLKETKT